ncbi:MAG: ATP-binding cassette domain-containing protein, partial [Sedimentisphaerales bacterium]|nr:ATP-binding cassette domain-containing protein [Sedimentisphaerales bacterium]
QQVIDAQVRQNNLFDKKLAREEVWIRKGVKARRVRNEGRVRALKEMRRERKERLQQVGTVKMQAQDAQRSGRIVIKVNSMNFGYVDDSYIIKDFSTIIERGDKIGFLGPNGIGKTTLMKLLLGRLQPQSGRIKHGTNLEIAYFDQLHSTLDEQKTVQENIIDGSDTLKINGRPRNIIGYLRDFLFTPAIARTPVWRISGGEKNRLLLAKMFAQPSNVLLLDEPTNDLDIETLDLLEDLLLDYSGTVLIITHDRAFLNNVVTSTFVFEGGGIVKEYAGGYDDWLCQRKPRQKDDNAGDNNLRKTAKKVRRQKTLTDKPPRLTYKEKLELEKLPRQIELLESRLSQMHEKMMEPEFYKGPGEIIAKLKAESQEIDEQLTAAYSRWEELEEIEN